MADFTVMTRLSVLLTLFASVVPTPAAPGAREVGNLVIDGIPDVPPALRDRMNQYLNTRAATFEDWDVDGKGMLISTRFGTVPQIHHVAGPGLDRAQKTFYDEPVGAALRDPAHPKGFYFLMDRGGNEYTQIYWFDETTGDRRLLSDGKSRNENLRVANAGDQIAYTSTRRDGTNFDLYVTKGLDAKTTRLVAQLEGVWGPVAWSPDDTKIVLAHEVSLSTESYLWIVDVASGALTQVNPQKGKKIFYGAAAFTKDGKHLLYASDEDAEFQRLVRYDLATGKKEVLLPDAKWDVAAIAVSRDGKWLAYALNEGGVSTLYLGPVDRPEKAKKVPLPAGIMNGGPTEWPLVFDYQSRRLGFQLGTGRISMDAFSVDLATRKVTRWTTSELGGLNAEALPEPTPMSYPTFDGKTIPGFVYRPAKGKGPTPVVIYIHGGPESQFLPAFMGIGAYWVNELGATVIAPNVRGSTGYGKTYTSLDDGERREDSVKDIGALLDWIAKQPDLDAKRVGVYGGSYGGFMVLAVLAAYPDRVRCGVDVVGISNFVTFLTNTESYRRDIRRVEYGDERDAKTRAFLERISPTTNAAKIKSPLFVVQGKNDPRVPFTEAEQIVKTVRKNGGMVWYLLGKDEGHGFQKKPNKEFLYPAVSLFFEQYLVK